MRAATDQSRGCVEPRTNGNCFLMVAMMTPGKRKILDSGESMVAKLKLKGIDGKAPPGVEPVA